MYQALEIIKSLSKLGGKLSVTEGKLKLEIEKNLLTNEHKIAIKQNKAAIIEVLESIESHTHDLESNIISVNEATKHYALTDSQKRIWLAEAILNGNSFEYNMPAAIRVKGKFDLAVANKAASFLIRRHAMLRTRFFVQGDVPLQQSIEPFELEIRVTALQDEESVDDWVVNEARIPFKLTHGECFRVSFLKLGESEGVLLFNLHHIVSDGISMAILTEEFSACYKSFLLDLQPQLPDLPIQFIDYVTHATQQLANCNKKAGVEFWQSYLADLPASHSLPTLPEENKGYHAEKLVEVLSKEKRQKLERLAKGEGTTLFVLLKSILYWVLNRYSGEQNIAIAVPDAGRYHDQTQNMVGHFLNVLVQRTKLDEMTLFSELFDTVKAQDLDILSNLNVPQTAALDNLNPTAYVKCVYQNFQSSDLSLPGLQLELLESAETVTHFDLDLTIQDRGDELELEWNYRKGTLSRQLVRQMAKSFSWLSDTVLESLTTDLQQWPLLPDQDIESIKAIGMGEQTSLPNSYNLYDRVTEALSHTENCVCIQTAETQISFAELDQKVRCLSALLTEIEIKQGDRVAIFTERNPSLLVAMYTLMRMGVCFIPIDVSNAASRTAMILEDAQVSCVLTETELLPQLPSENIAIIELDGCEEKDWLIEYEDIETENALVEPNDVAYLLYTSGSTGRPKGVVVPSSALVDYIDYASANYYGELDGSVVVTSHGFDITLPGLLLPLVNGGTVYLARSGHELEELADKLIDDSRTWLVRMTPSHVVGVLASIGSECSFERHSFVIGGEAFSPEVAAQLQAVFPNTAIYNHYGPTETVIGCSLYPLADINQHKGALSLPIGKAMHNTALYVLNDSLQIQPPGITGELCVSGRCVTQGYLDNQELTAKSFVTNPHDDLFPTLYKTGDLVRCREDGLFEFVGRSDDLVKINGFRIELGEVQYVIKRLEAVKDAVVLAKETVTQQTVIVAYIQLHEDLSSSEPLDFSLTKLLGSQLPSYMMPSFFIEMKEWPLSANGKLDKHALPEPEKADFANQYIAPRTETEKLMVTLWADLLQLDASLISVTDNFFTLGGHSLLAMKLIASLKKHHINVTFRQIFDFPQVDLLVEHITTHLDSNCQDFRAPDKLIHINTQKITPEMLSLVDLSQTDIDKIVSRISGGVANIEDIYALGPLQSGMLYHHLMNEDVDPYITSTVLSVSTQHSVDKLISGLEFLIDRHDILRTCFIWEEISQPVQVVTRHSKLPVSYVELSDVDNDELVTELKRYGASRFDITEAPLCRLVVGKKKKSEEFLVLLQHHHLIMDHVGAELLQQELNHYLTNGVTAQRSNPSYRNVIAYAQHQASNNDSRQYFSEYLGDVVEPTLLFELSDIEGDGTDVNEYRKELDPHIVARVRQYARANKMSVATLFHAAWAMVAGACSGKDDVVFGTVLSGRLQPVEGIDSTLGVIINTLPIRVKLAHQSVAEVVCQINDGLRRLLPFEQVPLFEVKKYTQVAANEPLFNSILNFRHSPEDAEEPLSSGDFSIVETEQRTNFPVTIDVDDAGSNSGFLLTAQCDAAIDGKQVCDYLSHALASLIEQLDVNPDKMISDVSVLNNAETNKLLAGLSDFTATDFEHSFVHELFEQQAEKTPDEVAVEYCGQTLTYGELNCQANRLAAYLYDQWHVQQGVLVGVHLERSIEMVITVLAILKSGAAYVPLDPNYPNERINFFISDAKLPIIVSHSGLIDEGNGFNCNTLCVDQLFNDSILPSDLEHQPDFSGILDGQFDAPAYVIYTSGSTGQPKGVIVSHRNVINYLTTATEYWHESLTRSIVCTSLNFDATVTSLFSAWLKGGYVSLLPEGEHFFEHLVDSIQSSSPALYKLTPAHLLSLSLSDFVHHAHVFVVGGEQLATNTVASLSATLPNLIVINEYGPTEATVGCSFARFTQSVIAKNYTSPHLHIGRAINNAFFLVLDEQMNLAPSGVIGELYIGGEGVAKEYLNQPELTQSKFVKNPYFSHEMPQVCERIYRTGDLVRYLPCGNLEFVGRADEQIKINGYRVEPGEIEFQLCLHPEVDSARVVNLCIAGSNKLVSYLKICEGEIMSDVSDLKKSIRDFISSKLPSYMIPELTEIVESWPLTANGKVDIKSLPQPEFVPSTTNIEGPSSIDEEHILTVWAEVLTLEKLAISVTANFFSLGGNSVLAIRLIGLLQSNYGRKITLKDFYEGPSIREVAASIAQKMKIANIDAKSDSCQNIPLSLAQKRLWFLNKVDPETARYNVPLAIRLRGALDVEALEEAIGALIEKQSILRTRYALKGEEVFQKIDPYNAFNLPVIEIPNVTFEDRLSVLKSQFELLAEVPFNLATDSVIRAQLVQFDDNDAALFIVMHHITCDGWSINIMQKELLETYKAFSTGNKNYAPLEIQYSDYAIWENENYSDEKVSESLNYWKENLDGLPAVHSLPLDKPRAKMKVSKGEIYTTYIESEANSQIIHLAKKHNLSVFTVIHSMFAYVLSRWQGTDDVVVGVPFAGREHHQLNSLIGFFVNTLVIRSRVNGKLNFIEFLDSVRKTTLDAQNHSIVPFDTLVEKLNPERLENVDPLFQIALSMNVKNEQPVMEGVSIENLGFLTDIIKYDLELSVIELEDKIELNWRYQSELFDKTTIVSMANSLLRFSEQAHNDPDRSIEESWFKSQSSRSKICDFIPNPVRNNFVSLFDKQVDQTPHNLALQDESSDVTYEALKKKSERLALLLIESGVSSGDSVAILGDNNASIVIAILATWRAGAAYVPLSTQNSALRNAEFLSASSVDVVLSESAYFASLNNVTADIVDIDGCASDDDWLECYSEEVDCHNLSAEQPAYIIFTSGSTGKPKGVRVSQGAVTDYLTNACDLYYGPHINGSLSITNFAFDLSIPGLLAPLLRGGFVEFVEGELLSGATKKLAENTSKEWMIRLTPSHMSAVLELLNSGKTPSNYLSHSFVIGGETLNLRLVESIRKQFPQAKIYNHFGPTETVIGCLIHEVKGADSEVGSGLLIGNPLPNKSVFVLDELLNQVDPGMIGELCVSGVSIADGYINESNSITSFIACPFGSGTKMYRTGDLVRQHASGQYEFIGRKDNQLKVRGYRIDLSEINHAMEKCSGVSEAFVMVDNNKTDPQIVAFAKVSPHILSACSKILMLLSDNKLDDVRLFDLQNGMEVAGLNRLETEYLYSDIIEKESYFQEGVSLEEGAVVIDVGANIGMLSIHVANTVPSAKVYAYEPAPKTFKCLELNAEVYSSDNIIPHCVGLSSEIGHQEFEYYPNATVFSGEKNSEINNVDKMTRLLKEDESLAETDLQEMLKDRLKAEMITVKLSTLSTQIDTYGLTHIDLLKIDVEGSELRVLQGLRNEHWPLVKQVVIESSNSPEVLLEITSLLERHNFKYTIVQSEELKATELVNIFAFNKAETQKDRFLHSSNLKPNILQQGRKFAVKSIKEELAAFLPAYMLPSEITLVNEFPLNANGKVNGLGLLNLISSKDREVLLPKTEKEIQVHKVCCILLDKASTDVSMNDSFFELGGHSLLVVKLVARLREYFEVELTIQEVFSTNSINDIVSLLESRLMIMNMKQLSEAEEVFNEGVL